MQTVAIVLALLGIANGLALLASALVSLVGLMAHDEDAQPSSSGQGPQE